MSKHNFLTAEKTIAAGEYTQFGRGGYFRLYSASGPVRVVFKDGEGRTLGQGTFESGEFAQFEFEQVFIHNDGASAVTVKVRLSPFSSGSDSVQLLSGTADDPLYTLDPWQNRVATNVYTHSVGNGNMTGIYLPPSADVGLLVHSISLLGTGTWEAGFTASTDAAIASEGGWTSTVLGRPTLGAVSTRTASYKTNATAAGSPIMAAANFVPSPPIGTVWDLPQKVYQPAGSSLGVILVMKNVSGVTAKLGLSFNAEELAS